MVSVRAFLSSISTRSMSLIWGVHWICFILFISSGAYVFFILIILHVALSSSVETFRLAILVKTMIGFGIFIWRYIYCHYLKQFNYFVVAFGADLYSLLSLSLLNSLEFFHLKCSKNLHEKKCGEEKTVIVIIPLVNLAWSLMKQALKFALSCCSTSL